MQRLWNPRTGKGLLASLGHGAAAELVTDLLKAADRFFANVEQACDELRRQQMHDKRRGEETPAAQAQRLWTELRIRRPELVEDNVTLPIQRLREAVSGLIKTSDDKDTGQELAENNRRLVELREEVAMFLNQSAEDHVLG